MQFFRHPLPALNRQPTVVIIVCVCTFSTLSCSQETNTDRSVEESSSEQAGESTPKYPLVRFQTSLGTFTVALYADKAPVSVENFLSYASSGFYDGTIFHRVIPGFVVQGGGFEPGMKQKKPKAPITNESQKGLDNITGVLAMARTPDPHSASSQFFINLADNHHLNRDQSPDGWGYAVFGMVKEGMEVVNRMQQKPTGIYAGHRDVPREDIVVIKAEVIVEDSK